MIAHATGPHIVRGHARGESSDRYVRSTRCFQNGNRGLLDCIDHGAIVVAKDVSDEWDGQPETVFAEWVQRHFIADLRKLFSYRAESHRVSKGFFHSGPVVAPPATDLRGNGQRPLGAPLCDQRPTSRERMFAPRFVIIL